MSITIRGTIFSNKKIAIYGVCLIYNVVLASDIQQSESVKHIHIHAYPLLFKILFSHSPLQSIE